MPAASDPTSFLAPEDRRLLDLAIEQAELGWDEGGVPIGAVLARGGEVLSVGRNRRVQQGSAILHGETDALERAGRQPATVYKECTLYTTLSPCFMCAGCALLYKIPRIVIGENRNFSVSEALLAEHGVELVVADDERCVDLMDRMMTERGEIWNEDIGE
ncbi:nucleoside deaminase [Spelaeicoccus albus]|uniref:Cytosine deaminase n=1 Tax=Spelaeicoccus albus TaxID=1280376 RepID=A0A7Z0AA11_9MICO|nr:nucleoside deaminase [Spelaeicoccus albus]NYI67177.1 cytosine deaminase [Spelaeicoccus albus]